MRLYIAIFFIVIFGIQLKAQEASKPNPSSNNGSIENQFDYVFQKSNNYQDYKVVKKEDLNLLKKANFRDFSVFVNMVLILYYSNPIVLSKLEVGSVPPFPDGNFVKEGDIYLLEQVFLREKIYKD